MGTLAETYSFHSDLRTPTRAVDVVFHLGSKGIFVLRFLLAKGRNRPLHLAGVPGGTLVGSLNLRLGHGLLHLLKGAGKCEGQALGQCAYFGGCVPCHTTSVQGKLIIGRVAYLSHMVL